MSSFTSATEGQKITPNESNSPSMLEVYIYSAPSTVEGIMFNPDTSENARKRSFEMYEGIEKLNKIIDRDGAKKGSGMKL